MFVFCSTESLKLTQARNQENLWVAGLLLPKFLAYAS